MSQQVFLQITPIVASEAADMARERFFTRVNSHVSLQIITIRADFLAQVTDVKGQWIWPTVR